MVRGRSFRGVAVCLLAAGCGGFGGGGSSGSTIPSSTASSSTPSTIPANVQLRTLVIETNNLSISLAGGAQQVQASGLFSDGRVRDLTHLATWAVQNKAVATLDAHGIATPVGAGMTGIQASFGGVTAQATLDVAASAVPAPGTAPAASSGPTWQTDVFPLLETTLSCKACHAPKGIGASTRMVLTGTSGADYTQVTTSGLIDTTNPASSVLLMKATNKTTHGGGAILTTGSPQYTTLLDWITGGATLGGSAPAPAPTPANAPDVLTVNPPQRNIVDAGAQQQLVVIAWWKATGACLDVTRSAVIAASSNVAAVDSYGVVSSTGTGTVMLDCSWQGASATAELAFDKNAPLPNGDQPSVVSISGLGSTGTGTGAGAGTGAAAGTATTPSANPTWVTDVFPLFQNTLDCKVCHVPGGVGVTTKAPSGAASRMILTLVSGTDYTQMQGLIDKTTPANSVLLENAVGGLGHGGGAPLQTTSPAYQTILAWISKGAVMGTGTPPATPPKPLPLSYTNTISVELAACVVCHAPNATNPQSPYLDTYARVKAEAFNIQNTIYRNGQVRGMGRRAGMTLAQAQQAVNDLNAWIAAGYPQ